MSLYRYLLKESNKYQDKVVQATFQRLLPIEFRRYQHEYQYRVYNKVIRFGESVALYFYQIQGNVDRQATMCTSRRKAYKEILSLGYGKKGPFYNELTLKSVSELKLNERYWSILYKAKIRTQTCSHYTVSISALLEYAQTRTASLDPTTIEHISYRKALKVPSVYTKEEEALEKGSGPIRIVDCSRLIIMNETSPQKLEERSYAWMCKLLGSCKAPVKLLETFFFQHNKVSCWFRTKKSGIVKKLNPFEAGLQTTWQVLDYFHERFLQFRQFKVDPGGSCYCVLRDARLLITTELYQDIAERHINIAHCSYIQECRSNMLPSIYSFKMKVQDGVYIPEYSLTKSREPGRNVQMLHKLADTAKILVMVCRQLKHRTVIELELDFSKSETGDLWLIACKRCVLSQAMNPEYIWRVNPPEDSMTESTIQTLQTEEHVESVVKEDCRMSVFKQLVTPHLKRATTSQYGNGYYQSDFQELLLRKYLRENGLDMDKLQQQPALLHEFEQQYSLADTANSASSSQSIAHKRTVSEMQVIDQVLCKTQLPSIRRHDSLFINQTAAFKRSLSISLPRSGRR